MPDLDREADVRLLDRVRRGDGAAFIEIYERYKDGVFRFAYHLLDSAERAEDVTQECFIGLMRSPARFDSRRASLRTYLYSAARNLAFKQFRNLSGEVPLEDRNSGDSPSSSGPLHELLAEELSAEVQKAIAGLAPLQREAIILFEYEGQSLADIAAIAGTDVGTVKSRLYRARDRLRRDLAPYLNGGGGASRQESDHER
jgi:RNA polymerase sigma-70 factor (ECF subfamily)